MAELRNWLTRSSATTPTSQLTPQPNSWDTVGDTHSLFTSRSVNEIRQIAQQTQLDIERKKEDLRQLVGERYRDLIDTADSIVDMNTCSECIKVLTSTPDQIWSCLESQLYLTATCYFLLARHVFSLLQDGGRGKTTPPSPALQHLWQSIAIFRTNIPECCRRHLQSSEVMEEAIVQSLCSIVLLEGCSLRQVFAQFLLARKAAIQDVFQRSGHRSVKAQVGQLVGVVKKSLEHIAAIFCQQEDQNQSLLLKTLMQFSQCKAKDTLQGLVSVDLFARLPSTARSFVPTLHTALSEIPVADVHRACREWIETCVEDVERGMEQLLQHVTTLKALASIRDAVYEQLSQQQSSGENPTLMAVQWERVCKSVSGDRISIWDTFLRPILLQRAKGILKGLFVSAETHGSATMDHLLQGIRDDPDRYAPDCHSSLALWQEQPAVPAARGKRKMNRAMMDTLVLKAKACTPSVFSFCQSFGEQLEVVIRDSSHFLYQSKDSHGHHHRKHVVESFPFDLYGDSDVIREYLQHSTQECISRFLKSVDTKVRDLEERLSNCQGQLGVGAEVVDRLLVVARVCQSLSSSSCCPPLIKLSNGCHSNETSVLATRPSQSRRILSQIARQKQMESDKNPVAEMLQQRATSIYRMWAFWCSDQAKHNFREHLLAEMELDSLASSLAWEEVTIAEESEKGDKVSSSIRVPAQPSVFVMSMLFALCQEICRVGGHAIDREVLLGLSSRVLMSILTVYEGLLAQVSPLPQPCALQLLFNVKFLSCVLSFPKENEESSRQRLKVCVDQLQSFVDPFDLDVFQPHLLANLSRQLQRSTVLLGMLLSLKSSGPLTPSSTQRPLNARSSQEKHIVIPLSQGVPRFPFLPTSNSAQYGAPSFRHTKLSSAAESTADQSFLKTVAFFHHL